MFLDNSLSDEEEAGDTEGTESGSVLNALSEKNRSLEWTDDRESSHVVAEQDPSLIPRSSAAEISWMCPLSLDKLSPSPSDAEMEESSSLQPVKAKSPVRSKNHSGVILKLRRMFSGGLSRKKARYEAIPGTGADPSLTQTDDVAGEASGEGVLL